LLHLSPEKAIPSSKKYECYSDEKPSGGLHSNISICLHTSEFFNEIYLRMSYLLQKKKRIFFSGRESVYVVNVRFHENHLSKLFLINGYTCVFKQ